MGSAHPPQRAEGRAVLVTVRANESQPGSGRWIGRVRAPWDWPRAVRSSTCASTGSDFDLRDETQNQRAGAVAALVQRPVTADGSELAEPSVIAGSLCGGGALTKAKASVPRPSRRMTPVQFDRPVADGPGCPRSVRLKGLDDPVKRIVRPPRSPGPRKRPGWIRGGAERATRS